jgi:hypothetical protein
MWLLLCLVNSKLLSLRTGLILPHMLGLDIVSFPHRMSLLFSVLFFFNKKKKKKKNWGRRCRIFIFLSCLQNSVVLNHISKHHTSLRKFSHTHTHMPSLSWVNYLEFLSAEKFVLIDYLTLNYMFTYFCFVI